MPRQGLGPGRRGRCVGWACVAGAPTAAVHRGEGGGRGLDPRHLLSPWHPQPAPGCTEGPGSWGRCPQELPGLRVWWAGPWVGRRAGSHSISPQVLQPRSPCTWVDPRGRGPKEQARADVLRFQGAISGAGGRAAVHRAAHPSAAAPAESPTLETSVSASVSAPGRQHRPQPLPGPGHSLPLAGVQRPRPSCASAHGWGEEPASSGPGGRGRGYRESPTQPVPNACPHEASTNRTSFFVVI